MKKSVLLKLAVGAIILGLLFYKVGFYEIYVVLKASNILLFLIGTLFYILSLLIGSWKLYLLIKPISKNLFFQRFLKYFLAAWVTTLLLPGRIGEFSILYMLKDHEINIGKGSSVIITDKILSLSITGVLGLVGLFIFLPLSQGMIVLGLLCTGVVGFLILMSKTARKIINKYILKKYSKHLAGFHKTMVGILLDFRKTSINMFFVILRALAIMASSWFIFLSVGVNVHLIDVLLIGSVTTIILLIPITVNGLGLIQATGIYLYRSLGIPDEIIAARYVLGIIMNYGLGLVLVGFLKDVKKRA